MFNKGLDCKTGPRIPSQRVIIIFLIVFSISLTIVGQQSTQPLTIEQTIGKISAEFGLTSQEQLILQPIINDMAVYYKAIHALSGQRIDYLNTLKNKILYLHQSKNGIMNFGLESVRKECSFRKSLYDTLERYVKIHVFDPEAKEKSAFTRPWGWVKQKDLPEMKKEMQRLNRELTDLWEKGDSSFPFTWPGYNWTTRNKLENSIKIEEEKCREFSEKNSGDFSIPYPILGWKKWKQLNEGIREAKERLVEMKKKIHDGTLDIQSKDRNGMIFLIDPCMGSSDDLTGWVTQKQIQEKIVELEEKKTSVRNQYFKKTLKIFRHYPGWMTETELEKSLDEIKAKVKEVSDKINKGNYGVYFPGTKKTFSRDSVDQEIKKISDLIEGIRANKDYTVPVLEFGWSMRKEDIENTMKRKGLTKKQRAKLREGLGRLEAVRNLEIQYHKIHLTFFINIRNQLAGSGMASLGHFSCYHTYAAAPYYSYYTWDFGRREHMNPAEFSRELGYYQYYYNLKINHLRKCLKLFL